MAIEITDLNVLNRMRGGHPEGKTCAILGDCHVYGQSLEEFKNAMGFEELHTFDVNGNPTHVADLNYPLDESFNNKYDWVIDSGTIYCCFDPASVFKNILSMLKDDGCIFHTGNLSGFFGRGFYSLSPALFRDFYNANNFKIEFMGAKQRGGDWRGFDSNNTYLKSANLDFQEDSGEFFSHIPNDSMICCFARRINRTPFTKPIPQHFIKTDGQ